MKVYSDNYRGPLRGVLVVHTYKRRTPEGFNYILELACGHWLPRILWRECLDVCCHMCRDGLPVNPPGSRVVVRAAI